MFRDKFRLLLLFVFERWVFFTALAATVVLVVYGLVTINYGFTFGLMVGQILVILAFLESKIRR